MDRLHANNISQFYLLGDSGYSLQSICSVESRYTSGMATAPPEVLFAPPQHVSVH